MASFLSSLFLLAARAANSLCRYFPYHSSQSIFAWASAVVSAEQASADVAVMVAAFDAEDDDEDEDEDAAAPVCGGRDEAGFLVVVMGGIMAPLADAVATDDALLVFLEVVAAAEATSGALLVGVVIPVPLADLPVEVIFGLAKDMLIDNCRTVGLGWK